MTMNVSPCQTLRNMHVLPIVYMCTWLTLFSSPFFELSMHRKERWRWSCEHLRLLMVRPEKPLRPTVALMLLMVEGTAAATPTLPTHMELMLR